MLDLLVGLGQCQLELDLRCDQFRFLLRLIYLEVQQLLLQSAVLVPQLLYEQQQFRFLVLELELELKFGVFESHLILLLKLLCRVLMLNHDFAQAGIGVF